MALPIRLISIGRPGDWNPNCPVRSLWLVGSPCAAVWSVACTVLVPVLISLNIWHVDSVVGA